MLKIRETNNFLFSFCTIMQFLFNNNVIMDCLFNKLQQQQKSNIKLLWGLGNWVKIHIKVKWNAFFKFGVVHLLKETCWLINCHPLFQKFSRGFPVLWIRRQKIDFLAFFMFFKCVLRFMKLCLWIVKIMFLWWVSEL